MNSAHPPSYQSSSSSSFLAAKDEHHPKTNWHFITYCDDRRRTSLTLGGIAEFTWAVGGGRKVQYLCGAHDDHFEDRRWMTKKVQDTKSENNLGT
jgi:hypothetical protein